MDTRCRKESPRVAVWNAVRVAVRDGLRHAPRTIWAVVLQKWLHYARYPANFWSLLLAPFFSLAVSAFMARSLSGAEGTFPGDGSVSGISDYRGFILASTIMWTYIQGQLYLSFSLETEMRRGTLEALSLTPTPRWCYLTGLAVYQMQRSTLNAVCGLLLGVITFGPVPVADWGAVVWVMVLSAVAVYGYGLVLASLVLVFRSGIFTYVWDTLLPLLAGASYSVAVLPGPVQAISRCIPVTYGLDLLRWAVSGSLTIMPVRVEMAVLAVSGLVLVAVGLALFDRLERRAKVTGSFGQF